MSHFLARQMHSTPTNHHLGKTGQPATEKFKRKRSTASVGKLDGKPSEAPKTQTATTLAALVFIVITCYTFITCFLL